MGHLDRGESWDRTPGQGVIVRWDTWEGRNCEMGHLDRDEL